jgi:hypothetical protein
MKFPRSPEILKGAFIQIDGQSPQGRVIPFQYNPETISRKIAAPETAEDQRRSPRETITFTLIYDGTDSLETSGQNKRVVESGIYAELSALELLLHPEKPGEKEIGFLGVRNGGEKRQSLTLWAWGDRRILPVRITELQIKEKMFDPRLNPLRAEIEVTMQALQEEDLPKDHKGYEVWKAHMDVKNVLAQAFYQKGEK